MEKPKSVASMLALAAVCAIVATPWNEVSAALTNRWSFNNTATNTVPAGTTMSDSISGAAAVVRGNFARFNGGELTLRGPSGNATGTTSGQQTGAAISGYVDLPNGIISSKKNLSVEIWATPESARTWMRLMDFGSTDLATGFGAGSVVGEINDVAGIAPGATNASDGIRLTFTNGVDLNQQRMQARLDGGSLATADTLLATTAGTEYHYVLTFEDGAGTFGSSGGRMSWYRNAAPIASVDVSFHLAAVSDVNNWLGRSQFTGDTNAHGSYNEVRLYNHALTQGEISANYIAGPNSLPAAAVRPPVADNVWTFTTQAKLEAVPGSTFTDSVGGRVATMRGSGGSLTGGAVVLPGTTNGNQPASAISAYIDLPNGIVSQSASVSFEAWAAPLSSKNWQRLFDFGRCVSTHGEGGPGEILDTHVAPGAFVAYDNLSLTLNNAGNLNSQQLEGQYDGNAAQFSVTTAATTAGTKYHYVLVVTDTATGCQARWYRNSALQNSADFSFHLNTLEDVNNWIGRSMYAGDSNSNLLLDEFRIYRRAITPAEILASYIAGPDPAVGPPEPPVPAPVPSRRWTFNTAVGNAPAGTEFADTATGEIAIVRGNQATLTGTRLVLPTTTTNGNQTASNISGYLDLPNGIVSSRPSLTFEAWITPLSSKVWQRVFDFGSSTLTSGTGAATGEIIDGPTAPGGFTAADDLVLTLNNNGVLGSHRLETKNGGGSTYTSDTDFSSVTTIGTAYQFTLTVQDGGGSSGATGCLVKWYRNGTLAGSLDLPYRVADLSDVNNWIGRSMWAADTNSNMEIDELRIYDRAISPREVVSSHTAGPDAVFPPPFTVADSALIHPGQKVLVDVLANDTGGPLPASLAIVSPPAVGTATVKDGKILYTHSGSSSAPVKFIYQVGNVSGTTATATVTIGFATTLRLTNPSLAMPAAPPSNTWQLVDALPGLTFTEPICIASLPADAKRLFVCERMAKIQHIADVTATSPVKNVFLDLQAVVAGRAPTETIEGGGNSEHGLLGLAFHPNCATNGYFYVAYTVRISGGSYYQRISRFKVSTANPSIADPTSELILLQQLDEGSNHDGGDLHFGPKDGYLYYTAGDEENPADNRLNSQKINKDFFSGMFRIDVDKKSGNVEPNAHVAIPTDGGIARFSVPIDNPFVHNSLGGPWNGSYNGIAVTPLTGVRGEFWCTGLRHTWRFSFDSETGDLWGGDVGQDSYEEVNKIVRGGNYGWVWREGKHNTAFTNPVPPAKPAGFTSIDPIYEYVHAALSGDTQFKGNSVVGGYVYRGTRYPALVGTYIFSDSVSGHIWQMNTTTGAVTRLTGLAGAYGVFSTQGVDPSNKDLLFGAYLSGKIMRLSTGSDLTEGFPATLTATGLFADLTDLSPAPGLLPYEPNLTFWSDHAVKRRWFTIPDATHSMTWSKDGNWTFPAGTVWVKHFDLDLSRGNTATRKRIETRVLVKTDTGTYGVSYRWNEAQTEATLVEDAGVEFDLAIDDHGTPHTQRWQIPSRTSCLTCHTPQAGHALSFNTRQLNRDYAMNGYGGNELESLSSGGFLTHTIDPVATLARHVRPDESTFPLEQRARSYFAVNCSYCHQAGGSVSGFWDGRAHLTLEQTGLIDGVAENPGGSPLNRYIVPGDPAHSIVLNRMAATNGFGRMPPLASSELDPAAIQLVTDWINQNSTRPLYQQWRDGFFAANDPEGEKSSDPDGDGISNYEEYLRGSPPLDGSGSWQATVANGSLQFLRKSNRFYSIQKSDDLGIWQEWSMPELEKSYLTADTPTQITLPPGSGTHFFRFNVTEP